MTNINTIGSIADEIETLSANLAKANALTDLLGQPAIDAVSKLTGELKDAKDRFAAALAKQDADDRAKRLSRFSDIRVETKSNADNNLISTGFTIRYMQKTWDDNLKDSVPKEHECNGFAALVDDAYEYLVTQKPQAIPAVIMALAPGKPQEAMSIYMQSKARGYFKGQPSA
ncbi:hypothetical protein QLH51_16695 [Sphingomonas sp. 2R-10]|uniref:hypothetical protein n=1 Tax=Sphingomonas sp. 2R-10 TaxID=3045148 RepID=UPI000F7697E4|nr:hypothetical protein [Sphingomonas sp. 2R-10]MDJ0278437.1 hypothetical protein [Sphingomonas sp. 2R-10]